MKILVAVKRVPDPKASVLLTDAGSLDTSLARSVVNPYDEMALDLAAELREKGVAISEIVAASVAKATEAAFGEETLRAALARAADRAVLVTAADKQGVALCLAEVVRREAPDLVLCGKMGADSDDGQTGPRLAGILGWPFVTGVSEIAREGDGYVTADRIGDAGEERVTVPPPAVITCDLGGHNPRPIPIPAILRASSRPLERREAHSVADGTAAATAHVLGYASPPERPPCRMVRDVSELVQALYSRAGGAADGGGPILPDNAPDRVVGVQCESDALAWIAGRHGWPLVRGILTMEQREGQFRYRRRAFAGRYLEIVGVPEASEHIVIVRGEAARSDAQRARTAALLTEEKPPHATRIAASLPGSTSRPDLLTARVIVAGGRALRDTPMFESLVGGLADALGGAMAASGGAVNAGIAPAPLLIGQTGKTVAPELYIALGISGADQHIAGMRDAGTIVAINTDAAAPIFGVADIGLVADVREAVPQWIARLRE